MINTRILEREKSRLKKVELLFNMQLKAVQEFNKIYQNIKFQDFIDMEDNKYIHLNRNLKSIREALEIFLIDYSQILDKDIENELNKTIKAIDSKRDKENTILSNSYDGSIVDYWIESSECNKYNEIISNHIENINQKLRDFLLKNIKQSNIK